MIKTKYNIGELISIASSIDIDNLIGKTKSQISSEIFVQEGEVTSDISIATNYEDGYVVSLNGGYAVWMIDDVTVESETVLSTRKVACPYWLCYNLGEDDKISDAEVCGDQQDYSYCAWIVPGLPRAMTAIIKYSGVRYPYLRMYQSTSSTPGDVPYTDTTTKSDALIRDTLPDYYLGQIVDSYDATTADGIYVNASWWADSSHDVTAIAPLIEAVVTASYNEKIFASFYPDGVFPLSAAAAWSMTSNDWGGAITSMAHKDILDSGEFQVTGGYGRKSSQYGYIFSFLSEMEVIPNPMVQFLVETNSGGDSISIDELVSQLDQIYTRI